jgi:hypothetical protein
MPHRRTDGGEVVSLERRLAALYLKKILSTHYSYKLSRPQGHSTAGRIRQIEKSSSLIGNRNNDLQACSTTIVFLEVIHRLVFI